MMMDMYIDTLRASLHEMEYFMLFSCISLDRGGSSETDNCMLIHSVPTWTPLEILPLTIHVPEAVLQDSYSYCSYYPCLFVFLHFSLLDCSVWLSQRGNACNILLNF